MTKYVKCPTCEYNYIDEASDLVCVSCVPSLAVDTLVYDLHKSIQEIDRLPPENLKNRLPILRGAREHLNAIIEMIEKD
jgi:hypothetical protein